MGLRFFLCATVQQWDTYLRITGQFGGQKCEKWGKTRLNSRFKTLAYLMLSFSSMTTMLLIAGGLWVVVATVIGFALCMAARRSMPVPTQEAMLPQRAARAMGRQHEAAFAASAGRKHVGASA